MGTQHEQRELGPQQDLQRRVRIPRPHRPPPDDVDRYVVLTDAERDEYDSWRYVRAIQKYWRLRERELRPPTLLLLARAFLAIRRWWIEGTRENGSH